RFPSAPLAHLLQKAIVVGPVRLQIEAEVQEWPPQGSMDAKVQRHQQAPDAAITVEERMDRLELHVKQPGLDEGRKPRLIFMHEGFECGEAGIEFRYRRRDEQRVRWASAADPVLRAPELAAALRAAATAL